MVVPTGFKCWFRDADVLLGGCVLGFHCGLVHNAFGQAGTIQGAFVGVSAVAHFLSGVGLTTMSEDFFVVAAYNGVDIFHAAIGNFDSISVKQLVVFVAFWEV